MAALVSTSPSVFSNLPAQVPQAITIVFQIPKGTQAQPFSGALHLVEDGENSKTLARLLPIELRIRQATISDIPASIAHPSPDRIGTEPQLGGFEFVKDEIDICFKGGTPQSAITDLVSQISGVFLGSIPELCFYQIQRSFRTIAA